MKITKLDTTPVNQAGMSQLLDAAKKKYDEMYFELSECKTLLGIVAGMLEHEFPDNSRIRMLVNAIREKL